MTRLVKRLVPTGLSLLLIAFLLFELTVIGVSGQRRRTTKKSAAARAGDLFRNNCARCHGADGAGDTPLGHTYNTPDFTDPEWWRKHSNITSAGSLVSIVRHGKGGMPAFGRKLTRTEIRRLVDYVRRFKNKRLDA